jgi:hypothetical protein
VLNASKTVPGMVVAAKISFAQYTNLIFSIALVIFVLGPPFLGYQFGPYPLMNVADVLDVFTPLVLLPLYWLLFNFNGVKPSSIKSNLIFMVFAAFWVLGQGMHLSANSIGHLTEGMKGTSIYNLTEFYDETLGHYLWHFGMIGLSGLLIYRQRNNPISEIKEMPWINIIGGAIYGFVFFAMIVEGSTVPMGLPFAVLAVFFILFLSGRGKIKQPLNLFFLTGYSVALLLLAIWGIWHHGFPGFFETGLVK